MSLTLYLGDYGYSSWSLRGWLLADGFGIDAKRVLVPMYSDVFSEMQAAHAPARTVPNLKIEDQGSVHYVWESLSIAETLHERHPDAGLWPNDAKARGAARSLAGEMHASFMALRRACPMNLRCRYSGFAPDDDVAADVARIDELWCWALEQFGGPYLGGATFTAADAMYAPVVTRFVTYDIGVSERARGYMESIYAHHSFRRWHALADADPRILNHYDLDLPTAPNEGWPRAQVRKAATHVGPVTDALNAHCPFSGKPISEDGLASVEGSVIGFCNSFCRDKVIADAEAWPKVSEIMPN